MYSSRHYQQWLIIKQQSILSNQSNLIGSVQVESALGLIVRSYSLCSCRNELEALAKIFPEYVYIDHH